MDFQRLVVESWKNTMDHIGPILLITFVQFLAIVFSLGILAPVTTAGYIHSLFRVVRENRAPEVGDLFSEMRLFLPLTGFFLLAVIATFIGLSLLVLPGLVVMVLIVFASFYLFPLMVDARMGLIDGLKRSWQLATESPINDHIIVTIIYVAIMSVGSTLWFAFLLTQPVATFIMIGAYLHKTGAEVSPPAQQHKPAGPPPPPPPPPAPENKQEPPADPKSRQDEEKSGVNNETA